jgi:hypothetical protein
MEGFGLYSLGWYKTIILDELVFLVQYCNVFPIPTGNDKYDYRVVMSGDMLYKGTLGMQNNKDSAWEELAADKTTKTVLEKN